jgi:hypothetical protein
MQAMRGMEGGGKVCTSVFGWMDMAPTGANLTKGGAIQSVRGPKPCIRSGKFCESQAKRHTGRNSLSINSLFSFIEITGGFELKNDVTVIKV